MKILTLIMAGLLLCTSGWTGQRVSDDMAIKSLIGEAIGQGDAELSAHAHAIRNRGTLHGVYGLKSFYKHDKPENWQRASMAWYSSELETDLTNGCTHWLSDYDLKHSRAELIAWRFKAVDSVKVGSTTFYRLK